MAGTVRTGPYLDPVGDWRTVNPQEYYRNFPDIPQGYSNWNQYVLDVLNANAQGQPGPRPYNVYGGDAIGNPDVAPMQWLQSSLGYGQLAPFLDQSNPQIQQMLDNMYYAGTSHDQFNFLGDQFFPALALLGGAVGGASLYGAGVLPEVIPGAVAGAAPTAGSVTGATGLALVPELEGGVFGALPASTFSTAGPAAAAGTAGAGAVGAGAAGAGGAASGALGGLGGLMGTYGWIGPAISAGGGLLQGLLQSNAAGNAADTQAQAARESNALLAAMYDQGRQDLAPYRAAGVQALGGLQQLTGQPFNYGGYTPTPALDPSGSLMDWGAYQYTPGATLNPANYAFNQAPYAYTPGAALDPRNYSFDRAPYEYTRTPTLDPNQYAFTAPVGAVDPSQYQFTPPTLSDDPGYQFRLSQGQKALDAGAAARGGALSGLAAQRAMQYGQELGSQEYQNTYNRALGRNQQAYARALQQNQDIYGRTLSENQLRYGRGYQQNVDEAQRALAENQLDYARAYQTNQDWWNRSQYMNETDEQRRLAANQLNYGRDYQANQDWWNRSYQTNQDAEQRALAAQQWNYGLANQANQNAWNRAYQYNADVANRNLQGYGTNLNALLGQRQQSWNELAGLAGIGQAGTSQGLNLGANLGAQQAGNITSAGAANAAGQVGGANAWGQAIGGVGNAANTYYNQQLLAQLLAQRNPGGTGILGGGYGF